MTIVIKVIRSFFLLYILLGCYGWFLSDSAIFFPPSPTYKASDNLIFIEGANQQRVAAVYLKNTSATHTILYSHGNAVDLGGLQNLIRDFYNNGYSILAYDYSGYGLSSEGASEERAYANVQTAYDYLTKEADVKPESIIAYGHSLGGAIAADLASKNPVGGLVLESTFVTAFRVRTIVSLYPFDKFTTLDKLTTIKAPVLVMHSRDDPVISFWHSEAIFSAASEPKMHYWVERAGHGGIPHTGVAYWDKLNAFKLMLGN